MLLSPKDWRAGLQRSAGGMALCLSVRMERLNLVGCALDDNDVSQLCTALHHNNVLEYFSLHDNHITAIGVPSVLSLKHITTLNWLDLTDNRYGEESCQLIEHELKHVPNLFMLEAHPELSYLIHGRDAFH